ncbi:MAG TPA: hypothetical protein VF029_06825 [Actinomycetota bacterium]
MATVVREQGVQAPVRDARIGWLLGGIAGLALVAVAVATVVVLTQGTGPGPAADRVTTSLYTQDELAVIRLAQQGVIPRETLDGEPFRTKALVNQGIVPREVLELGIPLARPLYCPAERALMEAVAAGVVPEPALDDEDLLIKRLINQGLVPRAAAAPCR